MVNTCQYLVHTRELKSAKKTIMLDRTRFYSPAKKVPWALSVEQTPARLFPTVFKPAPTLDNAIKRFVQNEIDDGTQSAVDHEAAAIARRDAYILGVHGMASLLITRYITRLQY